MPTTNPKPTEQYSLPPQKGDKIYYEVRIKRDKCKGCSLCIFNCPTRHLTLSSDLNKRGVPYAEIKKGTTCIGCGCCFFMCPESCIVIYTGQRA
jgi:2-oxoglutarate ferredoxin oxidoreductase subunit delta